jgi:hypothetical protein
VIENAGLAPTDEQSFVAFWRRLHKTIAGSRLGLRPLNPAACVDQHSRTASVIAVEAVCKCSAISGHN